MPDMPYQAHMRLRVALAKARAPGAGVASSTSQCHTPCQGEALGIDPSMSGILILRREDTKDKSTHACTLGIQTGSGQYTQHT